MSCTSCEDERNASCATRKAADGILGLDRFANLSGKNWKLSSRRKDDHSATMLSFYFAKKRTSFILEMVLKDFW